MSFVERSHLGGCAVSGPASQHSTLHEPNRSFASCMSNVNRAVTGSAPVIEGGLCWEVVMVVGGVILLLGCLPAWWSPVCNTSPSTNPPHRDLEEQTGVHERADPPLLVLTVHCTNLSVTLSSPHTLPPPPLQRLRSMLRPLLGPEEASFRAGPRNLPVLLQTHRRTL